MDHSTSSSPEHRPAKRSRSLLKAAAALAVLAALFAPAASQARPALHWQVQPDTTFHGLQYGPPPSGGEDYYPGLYCEGRYLHVYFYLDEARFRAREHGGDYVDSRGRAEPRPEIFELTVGPVSTEVRGQVEMDEYPQASITIPIGSPLYRTLVHTGRISLSILGQSAGFAPLPPAMIARIVRWCGRHGA
jgi:hypothetical protein